MREIKPYQIVNFRKLLTLIIISLCVSFIFSFDVKAQYDTCAGAVSGSWTVDCGTQSTGADYWCVKGHSFYGDCSSTRTFPHLPCPDNQIPDPATGLCNPPPPDCDNDGIPDDQDSDNSSCCWTDQEGERTCPCPEGTEYINGICLNACGEGQARAADGSCNSCSDLAGQLIGVGNTEGNLPPMFACSSGCEVSRGGGSASCPGDGQCYGVTMTYTGKQCTGGGDNDYPTPDNDNTTDDDNTDPNTGCAEGEVYGTVNGETKCWPGGNGNNNSNNNPPDHQCPEGTVPSYINGQESCVPPAENGSNGGTDNNNDSNDDNTDDNSNSPCKDANGDGYNDADNIDMASCEAANGSGNGGSGNGSGNGSGDGDGSGDNTNDDNTSDSDGDGDSDVDLSGVENRLDQVNQKLQQTNQKIDQQKQLTTITNTKLQNLKDGQQQTNQTLDNIKKGQTDIVGALDSVEDAQESTREVIKSGNADNISKLNEVVEAINSLAGTTGCVDSNGDGFDDATNIDMNTCQRNESSTDTGVGAVNKSIKDLNQTLKDQTQIGPMNSRIDGKTAGDVLGGYYVRLKEIPLIAPLANINFPSGGSCSPLTFDIPEWGSFSTSLHCDTYREVSPLLSPVMLFIWSLFGIRIVMGGRG